MNKNTLIIEAPELNDQSVAILHNFIYEILDAFETRYYYQLHKRYNRHSCRMQSRIKSTESQDPF